MNSMGKFLIVPAVALLAACFGREEAPGAAAASCLLKAAQSPCDVLNPDLVASVLPAQGDKPPPQSFEFANIHQCKYSWEGGRTRTIDAGSMSIEAPVPDKIVLTNIRKVGDKPQQAAERFNAQYRTRTAEEKARISDQAQQQVKQSVDGKHQKTATDFAASLLNNLAFEAVDNLADAAAWGGSGRHRSLYVLTSTTSFEMLVDRSDDEQQRRQDSIALARDLLASCS